MKINILAIVTFFVCEISIENQYLNKTNVEQGWVRVSELAMFGARH